MFFSLRSTLLQEDHIFLKILNPGALMNFQSFSTCHWELATLSDKCGVMKKLREHLGAVCSPMYKDMLFSEIFQQYKT